MLKVCLIGEFGVRIPNSTFAENLEIFEILANEQGFLLQFHIQRFPFF